jgi:hypothetical protein
MINNAIKHLSNLPGWRTRRKIVVFESDDWGSIRMPSRTAAERLRQRGVNLGQGESARYNQYDTLASAEDLTALFETLRLFRDGTGRFPVFTAVSLVANPAFEQIKKEGYAHYHHEPFTHTLERYGQGSAWPLWQAGREQRLFWPELHGREHLNVAAWLRALRAGDPATREAFAAGCWSFVNQHPTGLSYQAAFDLGTDQDLAIQRQAIAESIVLFQQLHGYAPRFLVPPNGPLHRSLEAVAAQGGIEYLATAKIRREPLGEGKTRLHLHYLGQRNRHGQRYLTRNASFEPSAPGKDWVQSCLQEVAVAFRWRKPAVVSTHRVNYIGGLDAANRARGLRQLRQLLQEIIHHWPEVEFMTSPELGDLIAGKANG